MKYDPEKNYPTGRLTSNKKLAAYFLFGIATLVASTMLGYHNIAAAAFMLTFLVVSSELVTGMSGADR